MEVSETMDVLWALSLVVFSIGGIALDLDCSPLKTRPRLMSIRLLFSGYYSHALLTNIIQGFAARMDGIRQAAGS